MIITNLKQGVKNPNRVNVFVDGKYSFSLDMAQVVDLGVKVGKEISEEELTEYKENYRVYSLAESIRITEEQTEE